MGRNNYRHQNNYIPPGARQYNNDQHDDREGGQSNNQQQNSGHQQQSSGRGGGSNNKVWKRLGQRQVNFVDEGGPRRGGIDKARRGRGGKFQNRQIHVVLPDEGDDDMGFEKGGPQAGRGRPIPGRGRYIRGRIGGPGRTPPGISVGAKGSSVFNWSKIVLRNGTKYDKIALLKELLSKCSVKFIPLCYGKQGMNTYFYLEDPAGARALKELDKTIEMPDGFQLQISVERTTPPNMPLTDELVEKIKVVMSNRYIAEHKALNLNAFHMDEGFAGETFYAPLWRSNVMNKVLTVIMDNIPELKAIDLSNNKLNSSSLEFFSTFKTKVKDLSIVYLADNKIHDFKVLDRLKGLDIVELKLKGNPCVDKAASAYIPAIRKIFPKLHLLDGKELPKEIGFDGDDEESKSPELPDPIPKMMKNEQSGNLVLTFLKEYFKAYDSDNRQPLLDAYHEKAVMSMSAYGRHDLLPAYIPESRNLKRVEYEKKRHDLLRKGKLQIVAFLSKLPKTEHDMNTFTLDLPFTSESLMIFTVTGCFKERDTKLKESIRHFNRCFIVVPQGPGFCIINETLFVCQATDLSNRKAFLNPASAADVAATPPVLDPAAKEAMAREFGEKSGMNVTWAIQCLEQCAWDFEKSASSFQEAKNAGKIPAEAFVK